MICRIETEQWHCEWRGLRLLPSPPTACAVWDNLVREFWLALQNRKTSSCCMAFFTLLSCHTCSVQSVCAHAGNDLTQKLLVKKQHRLGSQSPQSGSSTPDYLSTVLGNMQILHTTVSSVFRILGAVIICWADAAPVECAGDHGPSSFSSSSHNCL